MTDHQVEPSDVKTLNAHSCRGCQTHATCPVQELNNSVSVLNQTIKDVKLDLVQELAGLRAALIEHRQEKTTIESSYLNAGQRLVQATELLEMVLVHLPSLDLLFAQRVNRQFRATIANCERLQMKLFYRSGQQGLTTDSVVLNPIVSRSSVLERLPLFLDSSSSKLAYVHRNGRHRVYGKPARLIEGASMEQNLIYLEFSNRPYGDSWASWYSVLGAGSWRDMSLSQPICRVVWRVVVHEKREKHLYECTTAGAISLDLLLETIAATTLEHTTMSSFEYERQQNEVFDNLD